MTDTETVAACSDGKLLQSPIATFDRAWPDLGPALDIRLIR
jgi:hypothetical protein